MNANRKSSLEELLLANDGELISTPSKFANIIFKFESVTWNQAQQKAAYLIKASEAINYLQKVRTTLDRNDNIPTPKVQTPIQSEIPVQQMLVKSLDDESSPEMFSQNYRLLTALVPELEQELWGLAENSVLSGTSTTNIHGEVSIHSFDSDKYGYYLQLEINETGKPLQTVGLFVNVQENTAMVLFCESDGTRFDVYDDIYNRKMVDPNQLQTQNRFLQRELNQLLEFKLLIPTVNSVSNELVQNEEVLKIRQEYDELQKDHIEAHVIAYSNRKMLMQKIDTIRQMYVKSNEKIDELEEENGLLSDYYEQFRGFFRDMQTHNFKLLEVLIPTISQEMTYSKFTATLTSKIMPDHIFSLQFERIPSGVNEMYCCAYQIHPQTGENVLRCHFTIIGEDQLCIVYVQNWMGVEDELIVPDPDKITEGSIQGTKVLSEFFRELIAHQFTARISNRIVSNERMLEEKQAVQTDNSAEDVALVGLGLVGVLTAVFFGVKLSR